MSTKADKKKNKKAPVEETEDAAVEEEVAAPVVEKKKKKKQAEAAEEETPAPTKKGKKKAAAEEEAAEEPAAEEGKKKKKKKAEAAAEEEDAPAPAPEKKKKDKKQPEPAAEAEDDDEAPVPTPKGTKRGADSEDASAKKAKTESSGGVCCFLTGLSYSATDDDIAAAWEGVESVDVFKDPEGNSKGRGKVYFDTAEHAQAAIASGGATIAGRFTGIREWTDNGAAGAGGKFGEKRGRDNNGGAWGDKRPRFDDSNAEPSLTVFVRNLSYTATESDIKKAWKGVSEVDLFKDAEGNSKGGGKVTFDTLDNAKKAVENEGTMIAGRQVGVRYWTANAGGDRGGRGGGFGRGRGDRGGFGGRGDRGGRGRFGGRDGGRRGGGRGPSVNSTPAGTKTTFGDDSD